MPPFADRKMPPARFLVLAFAYLQRLPPRLRDKTLAQVVPSARVLLWELLGQRFVCAADMETATGAEKIGQHLERRALSLQQPFRSS